MGHPNLRPVDESLLEAVLDGNHERVQLIIKDYNGDVNAQDAYGASPALLAAKRNDLKMLKILVQEGADVALSDKLNNSPMHWAQHNHNQEMIEFIEEQSGHSNSIGGLGGFVT